MSGCIPRWIRDLLSNGSSGTIGTRWCDSYDCGIVWIPYCAGGLYGATAAGASGAHAPGATADAACRVGTDTIGAAAIGAATTGAALGGVYCCLLSCWLRGAGAAAAAGA